MTPRIAIVAGEASGDLLGARLIEALRERFPNAVFEGIAGPQMTEAGCEALYASEELSVMGLVEVLEHLPRLLAVRRGLQRRWREQPPDCFVGIDSPDFNLPLERRLRERGVPTVHYVSPTVWAWRPGRVRTIARSTDLMLCLFPFEPAAYAGTSVDAVFVGHPLADEIPLDTDPLTARGHLGLEPSLRWVGLLPGSRVSEVERLGPLFAETAGRIAGDRDGIGFVAPMASSRIHALFEKQLATHAPGARVELTDGRSREAMAACEVVLLASGTATLEAMLLGRPMVVAYCLAPLTHSILRVLRMMHVDRYALPNLLAGRDLVPEYMQDEARPGTMARAVLTLLDQPPGERASLLDAYRGLHRQLRLGSSDQAAGAIARLLTSR